jgi:hypothetical protein
VTISEDAMYVAATGIFREPVGTSWRTFVKLPPPNTVERCEEGEIGGPYYFLAEGSTLKGQNRKFPPEQKKKEDKAADEVKDKAKSEANKEADKAAEDGEKAAEDAKEDAKKDVIKAIKKKK